MEYITNSPLFSHLSSWGYLFLFVSTIIEAMPVGFAYPGHIIVIFSGFLAKLGLLNLPAIILISGLGAAIGDWVNFFLGRRYGLPLLDRIGNYIPYRSYVLEKVKMLVEEHPAKTLIIGRFNPITRTFSPFLAGAMQMRRRKFIRLSTIGGFVWASLSILVGYFAGSGYQVTARHIGTTSFFVFAILILSFITYKFINRYERIFSRYHLLYIIANFFSLYVFFVIFENIISASPMTVFDLFIMNNISLLWNPFSNVFMIVSTILFSPEFLIGSSLFLLSYFIKKKRFWNFWMLAWSMLSSSLLVQLIKLTVHRLRPEYSLIEVVNYSFPSAHAVIAITFFGALLYLFKHKIKRAAFRMLFLISACVAIFLAGFSRIYLNVHYFSDIAAGYALGLFCLTLIIMIFDYYAHFNKK